MGFCKRSTRWVGFFVGVFSCFDLEFGLFEGSVLSNFKALRA